MVGQTVRYAQKEGLNLSEIPLNHLSQFSAAIEGDVYDVLSLDGSVSARDHIGGTAPSQVREAINKARQRI